MLNYAWPIAILVFSNTIYQICAKSLPDNLNPLASLAVTYGVGAVSSVVLYYLLNKNADIFTELSKTNWAPFALGFAVVGLEVGFLYAYRVGWSVSTAPLVSSAILAVFLLFVGNILYKEPITLNKVIGIVLCIIGLIFINT